MLPACELEFIRKFLCEVGYDLQYCRQVVPSWRDWPVEFWDYELGIFVQIDGHSHWYGMHRCSSKEV